MRGCEDKNMQNFEFYGCDMIKILFKMQRKGKFASWLEDEGEKVIMDQECLFY